MVNQRETDIDEIVTSIWCNILDEDFIDEECNFFDAGATSHHIAQFATELEKQFKANISVVDLFQYTNVREVISFIENLG